MLASRIRELAEAYYHEIKAIREHLHQHPELSFKEFETSNFVASELEKLGVPFERNWVETGIVATIDGGKGGKTVALRADMDALPIEEKSDVPYKSKHIGKMHACGHDVHTACLLGAIKILVATKAEWKGTVRCIFQPGEEMHPGGASKMIEQGVLQNPEPSSIVGQHVFPDLPVGKVGFRPGIYMAAADELHLTINGKGGHGAMPHKCIDPILMAAHLVTLLQQTVSRWSDPTLPVVLTIGKIESDGGATNIIPDRVFLKGTFRTMNEAFRFDAHQRLQKLITQTIEGMGGTVDIELKVGYPVLENNPTRTKHAIEDAKVFLGDANVTELPIRMTAEDFAYYSQKIPACFYRLGTANEDGSKNSPVHTPYFDINPKSLITGAGLMAYLTVQELNRK